MYNTQEIVNRIEFCLKEKNIPKKQMLVDLNMGINSLSQFAKGREMSCITFAEIANYLDCSVDYLLGRTIERNDQKMSNMITSNSDQDTYMLKLNKVFNQDVSISKYAMHLWEARNEMYSVNQLLPDLLESNNKYFVIVFKYLLLLLDSVSEILFPENELENKFSESIKKLIVSENIKTKYLKTKALHNNNKKFIHIIRNHVAHLDHEKSNLFKKYIKTVKETPVTIVKNLPSDESEPVFLGFLLKQYKNETKNVNISNEDLVKSLIIYYTDLSIKLTQLLDDMLNYFFQEYTDATSMDSALAEQLGIHSSESNTSISDATNTINVAADSTEPNKISSPDIETIIRINQDNK